MSFAILRTAKLKTQSAIRGCVAHNERERNTLNADSERECKQLVSHDGDIYETVIKHIENNGAKYRKNSVLAQEVFLSASPEYFRPDDPTRYGYWDNDRLNAWSEKTQKWLKNQFSNHIVSMQLHLDEATPHIHCVVVPITPDGRLSARDVFSKKTLREMQTTYAESLSDLGIDRGIKGSTAKHTDIKTWYGEQGNPQVPEPIPANIDLGINPPVLKKSTLEQAQKSESERINKEQKQSIDEIRRSAASSKRLNNENQELRKTNARLQDYIHEQNKTINNHETEYKQLVNSLRDISLQDVCRELRLEQDSKEPKKYKSNDHIITLKGQKFYDHAHGVGGGGAIDLVMHCLSCSFNEATGYLRDVFGVGSAIGAVKYKIVSSASQIVSDAKPPKFKPPEPVEKNWGKVKNWLLKRKLPLKKINELHDAGFLYADSRNNAVFASDTLAEVHGTSDIKRFKQSLGSKMKGLRISRPTPTKKIAICESCIDAISYEVLNPGTIAVSTSGLASRKKMQGLIDWCEDKNIELVCAYDNDEAGIEAANNLGLKHDTPQLNKDWNDELIEMKTPRPLPNTPTFRDFMQSRNDQREQEPQSHPASTSFKP